MKTARYHKPMYPALKDILNDKYSDPNTIFKIRAKTLFDIVNEEVSRKDWEQCNATSVSRIIVNILQRRIKE